MLAYLEFIYGAKQTLTIFEQIQSRLDTFRQRHPSLGPALSSRTRVTEADAVFITYGDQVHEQAQPALRSLAEVLPDHLKGVVSAIHILPFYPLLFR